MRTMLIRGALAVLTAVSLLAVAVPAASAASPPSSGVNAGRVCQKRHPEPVVLVHGPVRKANDNFLTLHGPRRPRLLRFLTDLWQGVPARWSAGWRRGGQRGPARRIRRRSWCYRPRIGSILSAFRGQYRARLLPEIRWRRREGRPLRRLRRKL